MTLLELLWLLPLMAAVALAVGAAGRRPGEIASSVVRTFVGLTLGVVAVGVVVRAIVVFFA
jgi:hypothetical protein